MSKHTPGPWEIHDGGCFGEYGSTGPSICHPTSETTCQPLFEIVGPADIEECGANAALAIAAPALLAACKNAAHALHVYVAHMRADYAAHPQYTNGKMLYPFGEDTERECCAAILKAEGGEA